MRHQKFASYGGKRFSERSCRLFCRKVQAQRSISIWEAPNVLVLHLKRFEGIAGKITRHVAFPETLSLADFTAEGSPEQARVAAVRQEALEKLADDRRRAKAAAAAAAAAAAREVERQQRGLPGRGMWGQPGGGRGGRGPPFQRGGGGGGRAPFGRGGGGTGGGLVGTPSTPPSRPAGVLQPNGISPMLALGTPGSGGRGAGPGPTVSLAPPPPAPRSAEEQQAADEAAAEKLAQRELPEYSLTGVLVHQGFSAASGHYYSFVKDGSGASCLKFCLPV